MKQNNSAEVSTVTEMDKPKQKINVTKFLTDFRSGCSGEELLRKHGLKPSSLRKLLKVLEEKHLLSAADLEDRDAAAAREQAAPPESIQPDRPPRHEPTSACPQCGASVTAKLLTCPECGHVLPGEERWSNLEPKKGLVERVPPLVWGCIIALPIALVVFYTFKGILVSMRTTAAEKAHKGVSTNAAPKKASTATQPAQVTDRAVQDLKDATKIPFTEIEIIVELLTQEQVISGANEDYTRFAAGERWTELSRSDKIARVEAIAMALERSGMSVGFTVTTRADEVVARADSQRIDLIDQDGFTDSVDRPREEGEFR